MKEFRFLHTYEPRPLTEAENARLLDDINQGHADLPARLIAKYKRDSRIEFVVRLLRDLALMAIGAGLLWVGQGFRLVWIILNTK